MLLATLDAINKTDFWISYKFSFLHLLKLNR